MEKKVNIMDVTLRDGSYAINFQFSDYDTKVLYNQLDEAGIEYVEIGHGMGLDASSKKNGEALCSDEEYLRAIEKKTAKYGMFCIPGVARLDSLELLKQYGASFVRIGTNVNEVEESLAYIKKAKSLGLEVMANYMKSYVATTDEFRENVKKSKAYGADVVYIVDSAGSMNTDDIQRYYEVIMKEGDIKVGFHGHNNLGLAVANSLYAIRNGFDFVDTSLMGMGRSAGNASTELIVANMMKQGIVNSYNCKKMVECSERYIKPIYKHIMNALDIYCGIAEFHTSYIKYIHRYASKYQVNPLDLIMEYSQIDKVNIDENKLETIARNLPKDDNCNLLDFGFNEYFGNEQN